jgi:hypothetical protein
VQLERQRVMRALAAPLPAERLVAHVLHAVEVAGIDHVGIGSDYDGIDRGPEWLEDASCYGVLAELLLQRGFSADDVAKVLGGNVERVFAAATGPGTRAHGRAIAPLAAGVETGCFTTKPTRVRRTRRSGGSAANAGVLRDSRRIRRRRLRRRAAERPERR